MSNGGIEGWTAGGVSVSNSELQVQTDVCVYPRQQQDAFLAFGESL